MEYDDETEDDEKTLGKLAKVSLAGPPPPAPGFQMLLDAAALLGTNDISCTSFGCPIKGPHPEGLYRYPGPVPNSDLANEYFAPSIPPPAVVEAFNRIAGRPSLNDLHVKDYFFDYHTLPCRPSKHLPKVWKVPCKSQRCGVQGPHNKGAYLHDGLDASLGRAREVSFCFGISNPPPRVWEAALRIVDHTATAADNEHVDDFSAHHVRFDTEKGSTNAKPFQEWQKERMAARP